MSSATVNHINSQILNKFQVYSNNVQNSQLQLLDKIWVIKNLIKELHILFNNLTDEDIETVHYNIVKLDEKLHALQEGISKTAVHSLKDAISTKTDANNDTQKTSPNVSATTNNVVILKLLNKEYLKYHELLNQYILNRLDDLITITKNEKENKEIMEITNCREIFEFVQNLQGNDIFKKLIQKKFQLFSDSMFNGKGILCYDLAFEKTPDANKISLTKIDPIKDQHNLDVMAHYSLIRFNLYLPAYLKSSFKDTLSLRKKLETFIEFKLHSIDNNKPFSNDLLNLIEICLVLNYLNKNQFNFLKLSNKISINSSNSQLDDFFANNKNDWNIDNFNILKIENLHSKFSNEIKFYLSKFDTYDMIFDDLTEVENIDLDKLQSENALPVTVTSKDSPSYLSTKPATFNTKNNSTSSLTSSSRNRNGMKLPPLQINQLSEMLKETEGTNEYITKEDRSFNKSALDALTGASISVALEGPLSPVTPTSPFMTSKTLQLNTKQSKLSANNEIKRISKKFTSSIKSPISNELTANSSGSLDSDLLGSVSNNSGLIGGNSGSSTESNSVNSNTNGNPQALTALSRRASKRISRRLSLRFSSSVKSPVSESFDSSLSSIHSSLDHINIGNNNGETGSSEKLSQPLKAIDEVETADDDLNLDDDGWGGMDDDLDIEEEPVFSKSADTADDCKNSSSKLLSKSDHSKPIKEESTFNSIDEELDDWGWGDEDDLEDLEEDGEDPDHETRSESNKTEDHFVLNDASEKFKCTVIPQHISEIITKFVESIYLYNCLNGFEMAELIIQLMDVFYLVGGYMKYESKFLFYNDIYYLNMQIKKYLITKNIKINYAYNTKIENYLTNTINLEKIQFLKIYKKFNNFNYLVNINNNNEIIHDKNISILNQLEFKFKEFFFSGGFQELLPSLKNIIVINFLNEFYQLIINDILELKLISEVASVELDKIISKMLNLIDIFSDERLTKYLKSKIANFNKLKNFQLIVGSHLRSIMESFYNGEFYNMETDELINLINALFVESDIRRNAVKEIVEIRNIEV